MDKFPDTTELLIREKNLRKIGSFLIHSSANPEIISFRQNPDAKTGQFKFIESPINPEIAKLIQKEMLNQYFDANGYLVFEPASVINRNSDTIFITAGVQSLSNYIHNEDALPDKPIFISQPVIRTQFLESITEGSSINFVNTSTVGFNQTSEQHINSLIKWIDLFKKFGMKDELLSFKTKEFSQKWGDKQIEGEKIFVIYDGLEIGDASYVDNIHQKTRDPISLSDIGFGLERIQWILSGGSYFDIQANDPNKILNNKAKVYCSTLSLLALEGLEPSNKDAGYRFRQLSKKLVKNLNINHMSSENYIKACYNYWASWTKPSRSLQESIEIINKENSRNFNRLILDELSSHLTNNGKDININVSTDIFLKRLRGTDVSIFLDDALISIGEKNENK